MAANHLEQINYIGLLNQLCTKRHTSCIFEEGLSTGPAHNPKFTRRVVINGEKFPEGEGKNKQEAKQHAAKIAYEELNNRECRSPPKLMAEEVDITPPKETACQPSDESLSHYTSYMYAYGQRKKLSIEFPFSPVNGPPHMREFSCKCTIGDRSFKEACGVNRKNAKALAAKYAFDELKSEEHLSKELHSGETHSGENVQIASDSSKSSDPDSEKETINYIGKLNEYCLSLGILPDFKKINVEGPSHNFRFVYCAKVGDRVFKEAEGKKCKVAKQKAAHLALEELGLTDSNMNSEDFLNVEGCLKSTSGKSKLRKDIQLAPSFTLKPTDGKNIQGTDAKGAMGAFEEISDLGKGGYGCVCKARHKLDQKFYAVKKVKLENE